MGKKEKDGMRRSQVKSWNEKERKVERNAKKEKKRLRAGEK